jgi:hypothetical protein
VGRACSTFRWRLEDTVSHPKRHHSSSLPCYTCCISLRRAVGEEQGGTRKDRRLAAVHMNGAEATNTRRSLFVLRTGTVFRGGMIYSGVLVPQLAHTVAVC